MKCIFITLSCLSYGFVIFSEIVSTLNSCATNIVAAFKICDFPMLRPSSLEEICVSCLMIVDEIGWLQSMVFPLKLGIFHVTFGVSVLMLVVALLC
jgi:hypothetical protein